MISLTRLAAALALLPLAASASASASEQAPARIEVKTSRIQFVATTNMPGVTIRGEGEKCSGYALVSGMPRSSALKRSVAAEAASSAFRFMKLEARIPADSLSTGTSLCDQHMREKIFTTRNGKTPPLRFSSEQIACEISGHDALKCMATGQLTLRGVTRPMQIPLSVTKKDRKTYALFGEQKIRLLDFDIKPPSFMGVNVSSQVTFRIELTGQMAGKRMRGKQKGRKMHEISRKSVPSVAHAGHRSQNKFAFNQMSR